MAGAISPDVIAALDRVVSDNGWLAASRPGPLRASLSDVLGSAADHHRAELDAVVVSAEEGVPSALRTAGRGGAQALVPELTQRLVAWGMADELAASVVEAWAGLVPEISSSAPAVGGATTTISSPRPPEATPVSGPGPAMASGPAETPTPPPSEPAAVDRPTAPEPGGARRAPSRGTPLVWASVAAGVALVIALVAWLGLRGSSEEDNPLLTSLASANAGYAKGMIPPSSCTAMTDHVVCTDPDAAVTRLDVRTYADKQALYQAYRTAVERLRGSPLEVNVGECNSHVRSGELSWNHAFQHPDMFSIEDHITQDLTVDDQAQGRLACRVSGSYMTIIWTADSGNMLGEVQGPVMSLFPAWRQIHHAIVPPNGGPMDDMGSDLGSPSSSPTDMGGMS